MKSATFTALAADGDGPTIAIDVDDVAGHRSPVDQVGQSHGALAAAHPGLATGELAELLALDGIDRAQPDALTVDFDGVAIDDGCRSRDGLGMSRSNQRCG